MLLKKFLLVILLIFAFSFSVYALEPSDISAFSCIVLDADTLEIVYEKNAYEKLSMASTTKIMTSLLAVESEKLDEIVIVKEKPYVEGTAIGFDKGDKVSLEFLCYAMLLESGNDAALLVAEFLASDELNFSRLMNQKAAEIGMANTNFVTASGLDDENHYTTAYDMALLGAYAIKNKKFNEICSTNTYKALYENDGKIRYFSNHNKLLKTTDGVFGIKTGFTKKSGRCLVSACERNGKRLIAVTLKAPDDWNDHQKLYNYAYSLYKFVNLTYDEKIQNVEIIGSALKNIPVKITGDDVALLLNEKNIDYKIYLKKFYYAPVEENDVLGKIEFYYNSELIATKMILAGQTAATIKIIKKEKRNIFKMFFSYIS